MYLFHGNIILIWWNPLAINVSLSEMVWVIKGDIYSSLFVLRDEQDKPWWLLLVRLLATSGHSEGMVLGTRR